MKIIILAICILFLAAPAFSSEQITLVCTTDEMVGLLGDRSGILNPDVKIKTFFIKFFPQKIYKDNNDLKGVKLPYLKSSRFIAKELHRFFEGVDVAFPGFGKGESKKIPSRWLYQLPNWAVKYPYGTITDPRGTFASPHEFIFLFGGKFKENKIMEEMSFILFEFEIDGFDIHPNVLVPSYLSKGRCIIK